LAVRCICKQFVCDTTKVLFIAAYAVLLSYHYVTTLRVYKYTK